MTSRGDSSWSMVSGGAAWLVSVFFTGFLAACAPATKTTIASPAIAAPEQEAFQARTAFKFGGGANDDDKAGGVVFGVPDGKLLVVEFVSFHAALATGDKFFSVELNGGLNSPDTSLGAPHALIPVYIGSFPHQDIFQVAQPLVMYVHPGSNLGFHAWRSSQTNPQLTFVNLTVTGRLIDCPSGHPCRLP